MAKQVITAKDIKKAIGKETMKKFKNVAKAAKKLKEALEIMNDIK